MLSIEEDAGYAALEDNIKNYYNGLENSAENETQGATSSNKNNRNSSTSDRNSNSSSTQTQNLQRLHKPTAAILTLEMQITAVLIIMTTNMMRATKI